MTSKPNPDGRPALLLAGFAALLAALFAVSFATGRLAGPVAPGMHRAPASSAPGPADMPGMDMPGGGR